MNNMTKIEGRSRFLSWPVVLLLSALAAGCGGGDDGRDPILGAGDVGVPVPRVAPTVTIVAPVPNATSVAINTKLITAAFSVAMDAATLAAASFTLACPAGTPVAGTVTYLAAGNVATLTLPAAASLPASTKCTATVTTGVRSQVDGFPLASNFIWTFTTGTAADTTAPTVTHTVNANGATGVAINARVGATFSEVMDPATITNANFALKNTATGISEAGTLGSSGVSLIFLTANNLASNTNYTVTIKGGASGVKDLAGNSMVSDYVWSWTTAAAAAALDTTPPTVTGTIHTNGQTNVAVNTKVGVTFSEAMNPLTITNVNLRLSVTQTATGALVPGVVTYSGVTAVFIPLNDLANSTNYTVTVKGGVDGVADLAGNPMTSDFVISWTTGATPDTSLPFVTATVPASFATNVAISNLVNATFSEVLNPLTVTNLNFTLRQTSTGAAVAGTVGSSGVSTLFFPAANLASNTNYTATLKGGVNGLKDLAGNAMQFDYVWTFTTAAAADTTAPTVVGTVNANGATGVAINTRPGATFSEAMNPLTVTNVNFTARATATGTAVAGTVNYSGVSVVFVPLSNLAANTNYTLTVNGGANGVKDLAGNPMAADFVWSWTTAAAPDASRPTVTANFPLANATGVALNVRPSASFSEAMDPLTISTATMKLACEGSTGVGTVSYAVTGSAATFVPQSDLVNGANCTATITTGAEDLAGNALASDFVWRFRTIDLVALPPPPGPGPNTGPAPVDLKTAGNFVILSTTGITNVHASNIVGNIGASPISAAAMDNVFCSEITGTIYGVDPAYTGSGVTTCFSGTAPSKTLVDNAILDMGTAYVDAAGRPLPTATNLFAGNLGGQTIAPGLYKYTTNVIIPTDVTLSGSANDVWIFQISGDLSIASAGDLASGTKVKLAGGALAKNVYWQVGGGAGATLGTFSTFNGNLLTAKQVIMQTGAVLNGRALSGTLTTLQQNVITTP